MQMAINIGADYQQQINHRKQGWQAVPLPPGSIRSLIHSSYLTLKKPAVMGTRHCPKALKSSLLLESTL